MGRDRDGVVVDRRTVLAGIGGAGAAMLLPRPGRAAGAPRRGGTLRVAMPYNPAALDPITGRNEPDFNTLLAIFDGLTTLDPVSLEPQPALAKSWTWKDPKTLVLDLQENVVFHDGTPFDAAAVKFNIERAKTYVRSNVKGDASVVEAVEVTGKYQATLHLPQPNAELLTILADRPGIMVSPAAVKAAKDGNVDRTPVGTGPFKFVSWEDNAKIVVTRNDRYWQPGLPYLDGMVLSIINEQQTMLRSVIAGQNDLGIGVSIQLKEIADRDPNLKTTLVPSMDFVGAYLNFGRPPLDDLKVRQALSYGVDRDAMNKVLSHGLDLTANGVIPSWNWACDPSSYATYTYQPDKARKLLAEAGHPDGIEIEMFGWSDQSSMQRQELVITQLAKAGIRIKLTPGTPGGTALAFFGPRKQGAGRMSAMGGYADPSQQYGNLFNATAFYNASNKELPGYRALYEATIATTDREERKKAFAALQKFVIDNALVLTFLFGTVPLVANRKVQGAVIDRIIKPRYQRIWLAA
ncbi:MAG TPA: ABC transporter substrate-binding protein [Hyphomicrobiales bacterium]|nr:ABC transporter substrate-binding protein [Hyphomicrobiales bacterium]